MWKTEQKVLRFVEEHHLIEPKDVLVAGISGGADSVCLHYLLLELQKKIDFRFVAVHINHNLRGVEGDRDQEFVEALCSKTQVPVSVVSVNVREAAKKRKMSLEEAGRELRYEAFAQTAAQVGANKIVLAHHQDDLAETMLHHLVRGTGLRGLCSLQPVLANRIRPLLCLGRSEIEHYLQDRGLSWQTDSSNLDDLYTRNKIRHHVISYLVDEVNPQAVWHMAQTAGELLEMEDLMEELTQKARRKTVERREDASVFWEELKNEAQFIQRRVFLEEMKRLSESSRDFSRIHGESVCALWERQVGKKVSLPYQLEAVRMYDGLCIRKRLIQEKTDAACEIVLGIPGEAILDDFVATTSVLEGKIDRIPEKKYTKWLDYDKIEHSLVIRHRRTGDRIRVHPSGGSKKLKDYLIDRKIPCHRRDALWLVADGSEILWIIGDRISEKYKVSCTTRKILQIEIKGEGTYE